ncbi:MAG: carbohydrate kinase family protein [Nitriliruptor sp.]
MSDPLELLAVGDVDIDIYLGVPRMPTFGEKVRGQHLGLRPGGVAANVAVAAHRLGLRAGVHGVVGDDEHGRLTRTSLEAEGVDLRSLVVDPTVTTFLCVVHLDDSGEKALTLADTGCLFPTRGQLDVQALRTSERVHVAPFALDNAAVALDLAKAAGARTSIDLEPGSIGRGFPDIEPLLELVDVCFVNHHAAALLAPEGDLHVALAELHARGPELVVLTRGPDGAIVSRGGEAVHVPGIDIEVVDSTGAGDAFCAAFLTALHRGNDPLVAAEAAVVAGALACRGVGAQTAAPTRDQLDAALTDHRSRRRHDAPDPTNAMEMP